MPQNKIPKSTFNFLLPSIKPLGETAINVSEWLNDNYIHRANLWFNSKFISVLKVTMAFSLLQLNPVACQMTSHSLNTIKILKLVRVTMSDRLKTSRTVCVSKHCEVGKLLRWPISHSLDAIKPKFALSSEPLNPPTTM